MCFESTGDSFEYLFLADIVRSVSRSYLNSLSIESKINFSAFIANKAHEVAYFLLLGEFAEYPASRGFSLAWLLAFTKSFASLVA